MIKCLLWIWENSYRQKHYWVTHTFLYLENILYKFNGITFGIKVKHAEISMQHQRLVFTFYFKTTFRGKNSTVSLWSSSEQELLRQFQPTQSVQVMMFPKGSQDPNHAGCLHSYLSIPRKEPQRLLNDLCAPAPLAGHRQRPLHWGEELLSLPRWRKCKTRRVGLLCEHLSHILFCFALFSLNINACLPYGKNAAETMAWTQALSFYNIREHFKLEIS